MIGLAFLAAAAGQVVSHVQTHYVCERNHASVDWSPSRVKTIDLSLARDWVSGGQSSWTVTRPASLAGKARTFPARTDSIGGGEGIEWRTAAGTRYLGLIEFSDVVGKFGPETIWVGYGRSGVKPSKVTCGPASTQQIKSNS
jgi:hypothetical protein